MIRIILLVLLLLGVGYYFIDKDKTIPQIEYTFDEYISFKTQENIIKIVDNNTIAEVKLFVKTKSTENNYVEVYSKRVGKKEFEVNINETKLKKIIAKNEKQLQLKIKVIGSGIKDEPYEYVKNIKIDNKKPEITINSKTLKMIQEGDLIEIRLKIEDEKVDLQTLKIENYKSEKIQLKNGEIVIYIPATKKFIEDKKVKISVKDKAKNEVVKETFFLTSKKKKENIESEVSSTIKEIEKTNKEIDEIIEKLSDVKYGSNTVLLDLVKKNIVKGKIKETIKYGTTFSYENTKEKINGTYYRTEPSVNIHSVYDGKVIFVGDSSYIKNLVILKHNNNLFSIYGNLNEVKVKVGDIVKMDEIIGVTQEEQILYTKRFYVSIKYLGNYISPDFMNIGN